MNQLLYDLPRELGILPEAALAIARAMNERVPYLPDEVLEAPLEERRVRAIATKHDVVPRMSGETPAVLFELLARLSHRRCLHSLELLVRAWDPNEEIPLEVVADAIQPLVYDAWERLRVTKPSRTFELVRTYFASEFSEVIREINGEVAEGELRAAAAYIEGAREQLLREIRAMNGDTLRAMRKHEALMRLNQMKFARMVKLALQAAPGTAEEILCTPENVEALRSLGYRSGVFVAGIDERYGARFECPELRAALLRSKQRTVFG